MPRNSWQRDVEALRIYERACTASREQYGHDPLALRGLASEIRSGEFVREHVASASWISGSRWSYEIDSLRGSTSPSTPLRAATSESSPGSRFCRAPRQSLALTRFPRAHAGHRMRVGGVAVGVGPPAGHSPGARARGTFRSARIARWRWSPRPGGSARRSSTPDCWRRRAKSSARR
jgi:hypothetical protein